MSTPLALQDILVSIADSLSQAQQKLNNMPQYDSLGRPNTIYQLPYLDFNIVLSTKFDATDINTDIIVQEPTDLKKYKLIANSLKYSRVPKNLSFQIASIVPRTTDISAAAPVMRKTISGGENIDDAVAEGEDSGESITTISGRFVAVLPNEGLPQTIINVSCEKGPKKGTNTFAYFIIKVDLMNTAGEKLANRRVEFNFDEEASFLLNRDAIIKIFQTKENFKLAPPTFSSQEEFTDQNGYAETKITLRKSNYPKDFSLVFRINSGITTNSISILYN